jgi:hypothetical protein
LVWRNGEARPGSSKNNRKDFCEASKISAEEEMIP